MYRTSLLYLIHSHKIVFRSKFRFFKAQLNLKRIMVIHIGNTKASDGFRFLCFYMP